MFEFTCPKCQFKNRTDDGPDGQVVRCEDCDQPVRMVPPNGNDAKAAKKRGGGLNSPLLPGLGVAAGLGLAAVMLGVWYLAGGGASAEGRPVPPQQIDEWAKVARDAPEAKPDDPDRPKGTSSSEPEQPVEFTRQQIIKRLEKSACWIQVEKRQGGKVLIAHGSGTLVDKDERLVLTNHHVANRDTTRIWVLFALEHNGKLVTDSKVYQNEIDRGNGIEAKWIGDESRCDLALLQLTRLPDKVPLPLQVASRPPEAGEEIHTLGGSPQGNQGQWIYTRGVVRRVVKEKWDGRLDAEFIASDAAINPGDSGAGVVNNRCRLVGVNMGVIRGSTLNTRHISVNEVNVFLKRCYKEAFNKEWSPPTDEPVDVVSAKELNRLLDDLESGDHEARKQAASKLGDQGPGARKAIPALLKLACDAGQPADLHEAAVDALNLIGAPNREDTQGVLDALADKAHADVRAYAAGALGPVAAKVTDAATALIQALKDKDAAVRKNAAASLKDVRDANKKKAIPAVRVLLSDRDKNVRTAALGSLFALKALEKSQIDFAKEREIFTDATASVESRRYSCWLLELSDEDPTPLMCRALKADTEHSLAFEILGSIEFQIKRRDIPSSKELAEALSGVLGSPFPNIRAKASGVLVKLHLDPVLFPVYLKALGNREKAVWEGPLDMLLQYKFSALIDQRKKSFPPLHLTKEALESIKPALEAQNWPIRLIAAFALGTMREGGAVLAPQLRDALKKERDANTKCEMLLTFSEMGPKALKELGGQAEALQNELLEIALDPRADTRNEQLCAALALVHLDPLSAQAKKAYPVLAAKGVRLWNVEKPDPAQKELHERSKRALVAGGADGANALAAVCNPHFMGASLDSKAVMLDKAVARATTFNLLEQIAGRIGPKANTPAVQRFMRTYKVLILRGGELPSVKSAFTSAEAALKRKP
jgi:S1-C subfamily serine protease